MSRRSRPRRSSRGRRHHPRYGRPYDRRSGRRERHTPWWVWPLVLAAVWLWAKKNGS